MNIILKLYASLGSCLPAEAVKNEVSISVEPDASIREILETYNVPFEKCHLILVNGVFSPPAQATQVTLNEGDALAVWPPVAGG